ncbi:MAG: hypothetical protein C0497_08890 [Gemmatimonas sp.]|nr:hypothetical protein [Gemmatimonas sp.]
MTDHRTPPDDPRLGALQRAADDLPREVAPAADAWPAIRARIEAARVVPMGAPTVPVRHHSSNRWRVAAAAAVLVVGSSAVTVLVMRGEADAPSVAAAPAGAASAAASFSSPGATPPGHFGAARQVVVDVSDSYEAASADLERVLRARRSRLSPSTVRAVEESLRTIDRAIGEARAALEQDPASRDLMDLLDSVYRQKLDLLRRANELPLRSS